MKKSKRPSTPATSRQIVQGGLASARQGRTPDVVLQMPQIFMFDMNAYMSSIMAAKSIDYTHRVRLYDMYESALLDIHLSAVLEKRLNAVTLLPIEFQRDGEPDEAINEQLCSPWFKSLRKDIILSAFWGFSLMQLWLDEEGDIRYDLIDRKHYDPVRRQLLRYQGDQSGIDIDAFDNMLFVGSERGLGIFAELLPAVLYKRGDISDWAQFCNIFGIPIREYTYDAGDETARRQILSDARQQGTGAVYIHPTGSTLSLIESGNKTGSSDLYHTFATYWDNEMSIRVLGNTLTTDAKATGTQALGTIHKEEEEDMNAVDRDFILDVLNYEMRPIFANLGFNVEGGKFVYAKKAKVDLNQQLVIVQGLKSLGLPMDDDWLYETFGVAKPADYDAQKAEETARREALSAALTEPDKPDDNTPEPAVPPKNSVKNRLRGFFGLAPHIGADTDF